MKRLSTINIIIFCFSILVIFSVFFFIDNSYSYYESNYSYNVISSRIVSTSDTNLDNSDNIEIVDNN